MSRVSAYETYCARRALSLTCSHILLLTGSGRRRDRRGRDNLDHPHPSNHQRGDRIVSQSEYGRYGVSQERAGNDRKRLGPDFFGALGSRFLTLTVWRWEDGFDLARPPAPDQAVDLVTVRATDQPAIALAMSKATEHWTKGEILVFEKGRQEDFRDGDICVLQVRLPRAKGARTMLAAAHVAPDKRGKAIQFQPISPAGPLLGPADDAIVGLLRAFYRARDLR